MLIDWTSQFDGWLDRLEAAAAQGSRIAQLQLDYIDAQLEVLEELVGEPTEETAVLRKVRQSGKYQVWRLSHPFDPDVAVRLICWFPNDQEVVVALFAGDKAQMGDVFYDSVGRRADAAIEQWKREVQYDD
ncbi:hypothetical protein [Mycobacterium avium]|uniref:hypothetical protein n=1 Tax=Mycobacterium avium TaxID=1764 RepID=UPI0009FE08DE|nr:hypothetical protein [Mycobacterium avium]